MSNFIDSIIEYVNPKGAYLRGQYREAIKTKRSYDAATKGRRGENWRATGADAAAEIGPALNSLVARSRELGRNNPYAKKAINVIVNNTIGKGVRATVTHKTDSATKALKKEWKDWAEKKVCDFDGKRNFYGIQKMVMRSVAESGECIIRKRKVVDKKLKIPFQLQLLEADFLDMTKDSVKNSDGSYIINGVEFDKDGRRVAYWLLEDHPGSYHGHSMKSNRIPADEIIHIFEELRVGQVRGVPFGVSAMMRLRDFDLYEDAQLLRQQIAACFAVFVQDTTSVATGSGNARPDLTERVEPGIIQRLGVGESITFASPPISDNYGEYSVKVLQAIASGYGVPYESICGDYSQVNFSSGRMGWLEFARQVEDWQNHTIIPSLLEPVWEMFVIAGVIGGRFRDGAEVSWTTPSREMIDPTKETAAILLQIQSGLISWQKAVSQYGLDPEELLAQLKEDADKFDKNKLVLKSDYRKEMDMKMKKNDNPTAKKEKK